MPADRSAVKLPSEVKPFGFLALLGLLVRAALAYAAGFALYVGVFRLSRQLGPAVADEGLQNVALFVLIVLVIAGIMLTLFSPIWSGEIRGFALMTSFTLFAIAVAQAIGLTHIDPTASFDALLRAHRDIFSSLRR
jgi:hypothetical protein